MRHIFLLAPAALILLMSAKCKRECNDISPDSCYDVACTMDFRSISVTVKGANNQNTLVDSVVTKGQSGQKIVNIDLGIGVTGNYTVVDDHYHSNLKNRTEAVRFYAYRGGAVVAQAGFVVSGDCCHVSKVSGPDTIIAQ